MSFISTYVGPVLICDVTIKERPVTYRGCGNEACPARKEQKGKFCSQCGVPLVKMTKKNQTLKVRVPEWDDAIDALVAVGSDANQLAYDRNILVGADLYYPLVDRQQPRDFQTSGFSSEVSDFALDMEGIDYIAEKAWFEQAFAVEITALTTLYKSVKVHWMFLFWRQD